jgi:hypothetical protein
MTRGDIWFEASARNGNNTRYWIVVESVEDDTEGDIEEEKLILYTGRGNSEEEGERLENKERGFHVSKREVLSAVKECFESIVWEALTKAPCKVEG